MSDEERRYMRFTSMDSAREYGLDPNHLMVHMADTVLCAFNGDPAGLDLGFYMSFRDGANRTWTLSVIPEDGGVISDALLNAAQGGLT